MKLYSGISMFMSDGPFRMRPDASKCEPWHGQKKPPRIRPAFGIGTHPRCGQMPNTINHSDFLTLSSSISGSRSFDRSTALSWSMMSCVLQISLAIGYLSNCAIFIFAARMRKAYLVRCIVRCLIQQNVFSFRVHFMLRVLEELEYDDIHFPRGLIN